MPLSKDIHRSIKFSIYRKLVLQWCPSSYAAEILVQIEVPDDKF